MMANTIYSGRDQPTYKQMLRKQSSVVPETGIAEGKNPTKLSENEFDFTKKPTTKPTPMKRTILPQSEDSPSHPSECSSSDNIEVMRPNNTTNQRQIQKRVTSSAEEDFDSDNTIIGTSIIDSNITLTGMKLPKARKEVERTTTTTTMLPPTKTTIPNIQSSHHNMIAKEERMKASLALKLRRKESQPIITNTTENNNTLPDKLNIEVNKEYNAGKNTHKQLRILSIIHNNHNTLYMLFSRRERRRKRTCHCRNDQDSY